MPTQNPMFEPGLEPCADLAGIIGRKKMDPDWFDDDEATEEDFAIATHNYECNVFNEADRIIAPRRRHV